MNAAAALEKASLVAPPLLAPVLLEQAGLCFLSVQPQRYSIIFFVSPFLTLFVLKQCA